MKDIAIRFINSPVRFFKVGDPKQFICCSWRADTATYDQVKLLMNAFRNYVLILSTNGQVALSTMGIASLIIENYANSFLSTVLDII